MSLNYIPFFVLHFTLCVAFKHRAPVFDFQPSTGEKYFAKIKENEIDVQISPEIRVIDGTGPICNYEFENYVVPKNNESLGGQNNKSASANVQPPFDYQILNTATGQLELRVKPGTFLDCGQDSFKFYLRAKRCNDDSLSDRALIEIKIEDTNNHEPEFEQPNYRVIVSKHLKANQSILQLRAYDKDCGHPYGEVCHYEVTNGAQKWFQVTDSGLLRSTVDMDTVKTDENNFIVTVVAHDCGMRRSSVPAVITLEMEKSKDDEVFSPLGFVSHDHNKNCKLGFGNIVDKLTYLSNQGAVQLFPAAVTNLCDESDCKGGTTLLEAKISLNADFEKNFDAKNCDRESLSLFYQKKMCGADTNSIELLPSSQKVKIENDFKRETSSNNVAEKREEEVYVFDGKNNAVLVTDSVYNQNVSESFTLHFWMKRDKPVEHAKSSKNNYIRKENILCVSDDHHMNRHHFALYTKNCKLEVLFRREKSTNPAKKNAKVKRSVKEADLLGAGVNKNDLNDEQDDANHEFEPAEWRWHLDQTCDNIWHHYTLNVKFPDMELLVDGVPAAEVYEEPEILDDWPMHHVKDLKNRMVVGACWQGAQGKMTQHFKGYLSALTLSPFKQENPSVVQCLLQCKEQLEFFGLNQLKAGEEAVFNRDMTELTLKARNAIDFSQILSKVSYVNSRRNPTVGDRFARIIATSRCLTSSGKNTNVLPTLFPIVETKINVKKSAKVVKLELKGSKLILNYSQNDVSQNGVPLFPELKIRLIRDDGIEKQKDSYPKDQVLDFCKVESEPSLDKSREYFSSPSALLIGKNTVDFEQVKDGLLVKGKANFKTYEKFLEHVHYFNSRPDEIPRRVFTVFCSMYDGRVASPRFIITLNIEKPKSAVLPPIGASEKEPPSSFDENRPHRIVAKKEPPTTPPPHPNYVKVQRRLEVLAPEPKLYSLSNGLEGFDALGGPPGIHSGSGGAVAIIGVVCVCFLVLIGLVGVLKYRSSSRNNSKIVSSSRRSSISGSRRRRRRGSTLMAASGGPSSSQVAPAPLTKDLAWDDSGMTITINPIEGTPVEAPAQDVEDLDDGQYSYMDSDEEESYRDDNSMTNDEEENDEDDLESGQILPHLESNGRTASGGAACRRRSDSNALEWEDDESAVIGKSRGGAGTSAVPGFRV